MSHSQLPPSGSPPLHSNNTSAFRTINSPTGGASPNPPLPHQSQLPPPALIASTSDEAGNDAATAANLAAQGRLLNSNAVGIITSPASIRTNLQQLSQLPPQQQQQQIQPISSQPQQQQQMPNVASSGSFIRQQTPSRQSPLIGMVSSQHSIPPPQQSRAISHHHSQSSTSLVSAAGSNTERSGTPLTASQMHASLSATRKASHITPTSAASGASTSSSNKAASVRPASVAPPSPSPPQSERSSPVPSQHASNAQQMQQVPIFSYPLSYAFPLLTPPPQFAMVESSLYRSARFNDSHYSFLATLGLKSLVWLHNPELHPLSNSMRTWAADNGIEIFQPGLQAFPNSSSQGDKSAAANNTNAAANATATTVAAASGTTTTSTTSTAPQASATSANVADAHPVQRGEYDLSSPNLSANFLDVYSTLIRLSLEHILIAAHSPCLLVCSNGVDLCSLVVGCLRRLQKCSFSNTLDEFTRFQSCLTIREPKKPGAGQRGASSINSVSNVGGVSSNASSASGGTSSISSSGGGGAGAVGNASFAGLGRLKYHQAQSNLARDQSERMEQIIEIFDVTSVQLPDGANGRKKDKKKQQQQLDSGNNDKKEAMTEQKEESTAPAPISSTPTIVTTPTAAPTATSSSSSNSTPLTTTAAAAASSTKCVDWFRKMKSAERKEERAQRREKKKQVAAAAVASDEAAVKPISTADSASALDVWSENLLSIYSSHQLVSQQVRFDKKLTLVDEDED